jgi:hypothetical protein
LDEARCNLLEGFTFADDEFLFVVLRNVDIDDEVLFGERGCWFGLWGIDVGFWFNL